MSAGVIVMNRNAVALAADSAVTIGNHLAVHNSANKVFALSKVEPVGVITYANADFMHIPIEVIIKQYKQTRSSKFFDSLDGYVEDFLSFLVAEQKMFHFDSNESGRVFFLIDNLFGGMQTDFAEFMKAMIHSKNRPLNNDEVASLRKEALKGTQAFVGSLPSIPGLFLSNYIRERYGKAIQSRLRKQLPGYEDSDYLTMTEIACNVFDTEFIRDGYVGLAFTGYGKNDIFPKTVHIKLSSLINNTVRFVRVRPDAQITEANPGVIVPLAQVDVMRGYLEGIHNSFEQPIKEKAKADLEKAIDQLEPTVFPDVQRKELKKKLVPAIVRSISSEIHNQSSQYLSPILVSVGTLPIEELALLAESMINITSLRRRVALDNNIGTVGGPIDVAIITKADGLIWIKRKHFFDRKFNPQFFYSHYSLHEEQEEYDGKDANE